MIQISTRAELNEIPVHCPGILEARWEPLRTLSPTNISGNVPQFLQKEALWNPFVQLEHEILQKRGKLFGWRKVFLFLFLEGCLASLCYAV